MSSIAGEAGVSISISGDGGDGGETGGAPLLLPGPDFRDGFELGGCGPATSGMTRIGPSCEMAIPSVLEARLGGNVAHLAIEQQGHQPGCAFSFVLPTRLNDPGPRYSDCRAFRASS